MPRQFFDLMDSNNVGVPLAIVLVGPSGCGKTSVGRALARLRKAQFIDADNFHSPGAIEKMSRGIGLSDDDRMPWLHQLRTQIHDPLAETDIVLACSALKDSYRRLLASGSRQVVFFYLKVGAKELKRRLSERAGHFAGADLLQSQLDTLELPGPDEIIDAECSLNEVCAVVEKKLVPLSARPLTHIEEA